MSSVCFRGVVDTATCIQYLAIDDRIGTFFLEKESARKKNPRRN
jgi:hypothetical protein